jgi:hypothetical protein
MESIVEETKILLSVDDDLDGGAASLRTCLTSAGPDFPLRILKPDPSEGMGISETISLVLESADATAATVELMGRLREWTRSRGKHRDSVTATGVVTIDGRQYDMTATLTPVKHASDRSS